VSIKGTKQKEALTTTRKRGIMTNEVATHMDIDLDGIKDPNSPAPDGTYKVRVYQADFQESKSSGQEMAVISLQLQTSDEHNGKFVRDYVLVNSEDPGQRQRALWRAREYLKAAGLGLNLKNWSNLPGAEFSVELREEPPTPQFDRATNRVVRIYE